TANTRPHNYRHSDASRRRDSVDPSNTRRLSDVVADRGDDRLWQRNREGCVGGRSQPQRNQTDGFRVARSAGPTDIVVKSRYALFVRDIIWIFYKTLKVAQKVGCVNGFDQEPMRAGV